MGLSEETLFALRDALMLLQELVVPLCRKHGLTLQQFYVLTELATNPHQITTQVADRVGIQRTNFAAVRRKLEVMGLVTHERGKVDKRKVYLDLTAKGADAYAAVVADVEEAFSRGSRLVSEEDFENITKGIASMRKLTEESLV